MIISQFHCSTSHQSYFCTVCIPRHIFCASPHNDSLKKVRHPYAKGASTCGKESGAAILKENF